MKWRSEQPDSEGWWWYRERYKDHPWCAPLMVEVLFAHGTWWYRWPRKSDFEPPLIQPPDSEWAMEWAKAEEPKEEA